MPISYSEASWMGLLNYTTCTWDDEAMKLLPLDCVNALPPVVDALDVNVGGQGGIPQFVVADDGTEDDEGIIHSYWKRWPELRGREGGGGMKNRDEVGMHCQFFLGVGDGACANIGSKCTTSSRIAVTVGTSAAARVCLPLPIQSTTADLKKDDNEDGGGTNDKSCIITPPPGLFCYRIDKSHVLIGGALTDGGSVVEWARSLLGLTSNESFDACMEEVARLYDSKQRKHNNNVTTVVPFLSGERSTGYRDGATGCIMGLTRDTTPAQFVMSCLEGVILRIHAILLLLQDISKKTEIAEGSDRGGDTKQVVPCVVASGTALERNALWRQMLSDCSGLDVVMDDEVSDGTSRGAARLAASAIKGAIKASAKSSAKSVVDSDDMSVSELSWVKEEKLVISERLMPKGGGGREVEVVVEKENDANRDESVSTSTRWSRAKESQDAFLDAISPLWQ